MNNKEWRQYFFVRMGERRCLVISLTKWLLLGSIAGILAGLGSTLFLSSLGWAIRMQNAKPGLIWFLPLAGFLVAFNYHRFGSLSKLGMNLILEESRTLARGIPFRMAPLVLLGTIATHLCGGSAGREGAGIQIASSLTDTISRVLRLSNENRRILLNASIAGGFAAGFGTPLAGTVFALEVLQTGSLTYSALLPSLVAALVGNQVTRAFISHTHYVTPVIPELGVGLITAILVLGLASGIAALVFTELTDKIKELLGRFVKYPPLRAAYGGVAIIVLTMLVGTRDYNGLGLPVISEAVLGGEIFLGAFLLKILFTAVTIGSGFQGGEVTPLFFIGATLGSLLGHVMGVSPAFMATLGFFAVLAGSSNTPIACTLMGIEIFGAELGVYFAITCTVAYLLSGDRGIYSSQLVHTPKSEVISGPSDRSLKELRHVHDMHTDDNVA
jgi:H+/Cl- antiporter ClcA